MSQTSTLVIPMAEVGDVEIEEVIWVTMKCDECDGSGEVICDICDPVGSGSYPCDECLGDGKCRHCSTGSCDYCKGTSKRECDWCEGKGKNECEDCDGKGTYRERV